MATYEILVCKFPSIDTFPTSAISLRKVTTLGHKSLDYTMEK
uniref:Peptidyl-prolyl cis-trans isomerase CYP63 isoform X2 n=1 Tax=Rhizophora mucronata TaxID=61149 RepID=A0A2P2L2G4_RHIMU